MKCLDWNGFWLPSDAFKELRRGATLVVAVERMVRAHWCAKFVCAFAVHASHAASAFDENTTFFAMHTLFKRIIALHFGPIVVGRQELWRIGVLGTLWSILIDFVATFELILYVLVPFLNGRPPLEVFVQVLHRGRNPFDRMSLKSTSDKILDCLVKHGLGFRGVVDRCR